VLRKIVLVGYLSAGGKKLARFSRGNIAKLLSRDGDHQVFEQLLAEDDSDLKQRKKSVLLMYLVFNGT
jgi:hypothetical protein